MTATYYPYSWDTRAFERSNAYFFNRDCCFQECAHRCKVHEDHNGTTHSYPGHSLALSREKHGCNTSEVHMMAQHFNNFGTRTWHFGQPIEKNKNLASRRRGKTKNKFKVFQFKSISKNNCSLVLNLVRRTEQNVRQSNAQYAWMCYQTQEIELPLPLNSTDVADTSCFPPAISVTRPRRRTRDFQGSAVALL